MTALARPEARTEVAQSETAAILSVIERAALNPDVDIDKMERLLQMQERIVARNAKSAYAAAMSEMQKDLPTISKKGINTHTEKAYGRWEDIHSEITPILSAHGFALTFRTSTADKVTVTAVLSHREGHSEETSLTLPSDIGKGRNDVQAIGSSISYGKRYTACAILNINLGGEDDDGKTAGDAPPEETEVQAFVKEVDKHKASLARLLKAVGAENVHGLTGKQLKEARDKLNAWVAAKEATK